MTVGRSGAVVRAARPAAESVRTCRRGAARRFPGSPSVPVRSWQPERARAWFDSGVVRFHGARVEESSKVYAVARLDVAQAGTHGWQVRLQRRGVKYAKYFSDRVCGGRDEAFGAAIRWRDRILRKLEDDEAVRVCRRSPRNQSGVVGVSKVRVTTSSGSEYEFWQATWSPGKGKRRCVKFSVMRYGEAEAFRLAVRARREATGR